jgi:stage V sporulation protein B
MSKSTKKGTNFLVQGSILAFASIISRIIGLVYRLPMTDIIGDLGNSYYGSAYEVYSIMLIISSYSLPLAVSKLVSAQVAKGKRRMAYQVFKGAMLFALISGTLFSLLVFFGANFFAETYLKTPNCIFALRVLAPALLIVAVLGVLRGFFQGMGTMMPSAISQIVEQIVNAIVSVWAAYMLYGYGKRIGGVLGDPEHYSAAYGAAGGTLGTNLGSVAGLLFMIFVFFVYMGVFKRQMKREKISVMEPFAETIKVLVITIIPVLLSTTIYNISSFIDNGVYKQIAYAQGYVSDDIDIWWGVYTGKYKLLINVPISIASAMAASSVPTLTGSFGKGDMKAVRHEINAAMRFVMVIAFPCAVGLAVLAKPIFLLLFPSTSQTLDLAGAMMYMGSIAVVFYSMSTLSNGLLQGINRLKVPVINAAIALVLHVILLVVMMLFFRWNIYAVVLSNVLFALIMCVLNSLALARYSGYRQEIVRTFLIPAICSVVMGAAAWGVYHLLYKISAKNALSLIVAMVVAVVVYAVMMLLLHGLTEKEILRFPKGELLVRLAKKAHLLK